MNAPLTVDELVRVCAIACPGCGKAATFACGGEASAIVTCKARIRKALGPKRWI